MKLRVFTEPQQGASYDQLLAVARTAEELGFDAFFRSDHYHHMGPGDGVPGPTDAWTTLAALARETATIRLGTLVSSATFRHPGILAIQVAQVDAMSGGRVELGLGAGWFEQEHLAYGIPFPSSLRERFDRLEDQLAIVRGLWTTPVGERFSYDGRYHSVVESPALPKPEQRPHPPIIIGGGGPKRTPRLAARYASEFNAPPFPHTADVAGAMFSRVRAACESEGRDPSTMTFSAAVVVCVGATEGELHRRAGALQRPLDQIRSGAAVGTPQEVVDKLAAYGQAGADRIYLQTFDLDDLDHLRLVAADVMPHLA
ncbi:MAG TPA: LLM class F420-dependent oxidoreductase [Acidimicrobiales bacterium]|jgi:F420-dependent oxidoreductase-like protein|nr:LLM class F420-dependent oxidoreductase [Acidimicrobiales bacterium]